MRVKRGLFRIVVVLVTVFFVGGFFIPQQWKVSRSIVINAKPEEIYPLVSNFKAWDKWVTWNTAKDSTLKYTYEGPEAGVGAKQKWTSEKMGQGWMELTKADPQTGVAYDLFIDMKYSQSTLHGTIRFSEDQGATKVTWTDRGNSGTGYVKRWMSLLLKPMLGKEFNIGLVNLKELVEKQSPQAS